MAGNIRNMRVLIYHKSLEVYMQPLEKERLKFTNRQHICQYIKPKTWEVFFHFLKTLRAK